MAFLLHSIFSIKQKVAKDNKQHKLSDAFCPEEGVAEKTNALLC